MFSWFSFFMFRCRSTWRIFVCYSGWAQAWCNFRSCDCSYVVLDLYISNSHLPKMVRQERIYPVIQFYLMYIAIVKTYPFGSFFLSLSKLSLQNFNNEQNSVSVKKHITQALVKMHFKILYRKLCIFVYFCDKHFISKLKWKSVFKTNFHARYVL